MSSPTVFIRLTSIALTASLSLTPAAAQDTTRAVADTTAKKPGAKDLPLEMTRNVRFTTDEASWISLDVAPSGSSIVFEILGDNVATSYVERKNLDMRMQMRRFTRLTNGFSKKAGNHAHAVSLYFMFYNYCRPHQTLTKAARGIHTTPAMAAGISDHVWTVEEILAKMRPDYLLQSN